MQMAEVPRRRRTKAPRSRRIKPLHPWEVGQRSPKRAVWGSCWELGSHPGWFVVVVVVVVVVGGDVVCFFSE